MISCLVALQPPLVTFLSKLIECSPNSASLKKLDIGKVTSINNYKNDVKMNWKVSVVFTDSFPPVVNASLPVQEVSPIAKNVSHSNPSSTEILSPHGTALIKGVVIPSSNHYEKQELLSYALPPKGAFLFQFFKKTDVVLRSMQNFLNVAQVREPLDRLMDGNEDAHERDEDFCGVVGVDMHWEERIERTKALDGIEEDIAVNAMVQIQFIRPPTTSLVEVLNLQRSR
ncbi:hypothetical protein SDJN03_07972, partial [Cucurbita argyrosperma subsp. sororia]